MQQIVGVTLSNKLNNKSLSSEQILHAKFSTRNSTAQRASKSNLELGAFIKRENQT